MTQVSWRISLPNVLPVGVNHEYVYIPYLDAAGRPKVRKALTDEAKVFRAHVELAMGASGFRFDRKKCYDFTMDVTFPNWRFDVDAGKLAQDSVFGTRGDNRVVEHHCFKKIRKGVKQTVILITEVAEP